MKVYRKLEKKLSDRSQEVFFTNLFHSFQILIFFSLLTNDYFCYNYFAASSSYHKYFIIY